MLELAYNGETVLVIFSPWVVLPEVFLLVRFEFAGLLVLFLEVAARFLVGVLVWLVFLLSSFFLLTKGHLTLDSDAA